MAQLESETIIELRCTTIDSVIERPAEKPHLYRLNGFVVYSSDGHGWYRQEWKSAKLIAALAEKFDIDIPSEGNGDTIPTEIAISGMPEIAAYLYAICKLDKFEVAESISVQSLTVDRYLNRFLSDFDEDGMVKSIWDIRKEMH